MRSLLFVPADSERKLEKALSCGADALIVDLEDSVAPARKAEARRIAAGFIAAARAAAPRPQLLVRVNALSSGLVDDDLAGVMAAQPDGIMLPKTVGGADVQHLGAKLAVHEATAGLPDGGTRILAIATETARGVFALGSLAGVSPRLAAVAWGCEDLSADVGSEATRAENGDLLPPYRLVRHLALLAAAAAEADAVDTIFPNFRDAEALARECREARRDGFVAKMAIHPAQVPIINAAFTPSAEALAWARRVVAAFAADPGVGVVGIDGEMIDRPHLKRAERLLGRGRGD